MTCEKKKTLHGCSRTLHLAGLIHGAGDDEGTVPVELNVADFASVTHQGVDAAEKRRKNPAGLQKRSLERRNRG